MFVHVYQKTWLRFYYPNEHYHLPVVYSKIGGLYALSKEKQFGKRKELFETEPLLKWLIIQPEQKEVSSSGIATSCSSTKDSCS